jgi:hypothetical protein
LDSLANARRLGALLIQFLFLSKHYSQSVVPGSSSGKIFGHPLVVEVRYVTWNHREVFNKLAEQGVGFAKLTSPFWARPLGPPLGLLRT